MDDGVTPGGPMVEATDSTRNTGEDIEPRVGEENYGLNAAFKEKVAIGTRRSARNK